MHKLEFTSHDWGRIYRRIRDSDLKISISGSRSWLIENYGATVDSVQHNGYWYVHIYFQEPARATEFMLRYA